MKKIITIVFIVGVVISGIVLVSNEDLVDAIEKKLQISKDPLKEKNYRFVSKSSIYVATFSIIVGRYELVGVVFSGFVLYPKFKLYSNGNKRSINREKLDIIVPRNTSLKDLATLLLKKKIIDNSVAFINVGEYKNLTSNKIASGKYSIKPKTTYKNLLNGFTLNSRGNGNNEIEVAVQFNECKSISDLSHQVAKQLELNEDELVSEINKTDFSVYNISVSKEQIPALFLPNTYKMYYDISAKEFIEKMMKEYKKFWTKDRMDKMKNIGLSSPIEVSTLASIVYEEQKQIPDEWPKIAAVYLNRLANPKKFPKLQSCPTIKFCDSTIYGQPLPDDIERNKDNPYNTYTHDGLPPGPINLPSEKVIDAVLNCSKEKYVYMCARPDYSGRNNFSTTLPEHNRNSDAWHKWYSAEKKKKSK